MIAASLRPRILSFERICLFLERPCPSNLHGHTENYIILLRSLFIIK